MKTKTEEKVETKTKQLLQALEVFYETTNRFPDSKEERELAEIACHVRHCDSSSFGYPSLRRRYPESCIKILDCEVKIFVTTKMKELVDFMKEKNRAPMINKDEIEHFIFLLWAKKNVDSLEEYNILDETIFIHKEEMEFDVQNFLLPKRKDINSNDKKISSDHAKAEEFLLRVNTFSKAKESLLNNFESFMETPYDTNYKFNLELVSKANETVGAWENLNTYINKTVKKKDEETDQEIEVTNMDLIAKNTFVKEIIEDESARKIRFIGTYIPSEETDKKKKKKKTSK